MLVSIITPTFNRSHMLCRAIKSVLAQTFTHWELIIVDDCSSDDTESVVKRYNDSRIKYIKLEKNTGGSFIPRQKGLEISTGKYIAVLDDDDSWIDNRKLELQVEYLENNPDYVLVGTDAVAKEGLSYSCINFPKGDKSIRKMILIGNCFCHSGVMYRRETIDKTGSYEVVKGGYYNGQCNEYDLWLRMGLVGKLANLPIYGVSYNNEYRKISFGDRLTFLDMYMEAINKYKSYYHNWIMAVIIQHIFTWLELPGLVEVKELARKAIRG